MRINKNLKNFFLIACMLVLIFEDTQAIAASIDIYQYTRANFFSPVVKNALFRVYVPNSDGDTISVIDPSTYQVIQTFYTGKGPQHVVPSYDLKTLWVLNNKSNSATPIDPATAKPGMSVSVDDPYNLYFTPDGKFAIIVCEARKELQFRDPETLKPLYSLPIACNGANHMDFTVDNHYAIVTCEFSGQLMKVDLVKRQIVGYLSLVAKKVEKTILTHPVSDMTITADGHIAIGDVDAETTPLNMQSMPQDIRSSADGQVFYVADMMKDGVILINPNRFIQIGFIPTGMGTHAIYPSRDGKLFYISNRGCHHVRCGPHGPGSISVLDPIKKAVVATWSIPQGGSPDMGNVSADGKELWLSGRYDNEVYVFDTTIGKLTHRIPVGSGPHGLTVWPQPGRYSLGHTGNMR